MILDQSDKQIKEEGDEVDLVFEEGAVYGLNECILGVFSVGCKFDGCIGEAVFEEIQHRFKYKTAQLFAVLNKHFFLEHERKVVPYIVSEHMLPL